MYLHNNIWMSSSSTSDAEIGVYENNMRLRDLACFLFLTCQITTTLTMTTRTRTPADMMPPTNNQSVLVLLGTLWWIILSNGESVSLLSFGLSRVIFSGNGIHKSPEQQQISTSCPLSYKIWWTLLHLLTEWCFVMNK